MNYDELKSIEDSAEAMWRDNPWLVARLNAADDAKNKKKADSLAFHGKRLAASKTAHNRQNAILNDAAVDSLPDSE